MMLEVAHKKLYRFEKRTTSYMSGAAKPVKLLMGMEFYNLMLEPSFPAAQTILILES